MNDPNPYRGPDSTVAQVARDASAEELAGRGTRLGAALIDALILLVIVVPLMYFGGYWTAAMNAAQTGGSVGIGTTLMWALIGFVVLVAVQFVPLNASGQTWGKRITGIKIVDLNGDKPPIGRLLGLRYFPVQIASNIPLLGPLLAIVNVLLIFRNDRRCGHDLIAGTRVVPVR